MVRGRQHLPSRGPLLIVANHPNALVDAMLVATTVPRPVLITARATLFEHRALARFLQRIGVVPLLRTQDVSPSAQGTGSLVRNDASLDHVSNALQRGEVVVIFPEGTSHDAPTMAPLKSGAARIALHAHAGGVRGLHIVPIGLVYERKERPGSRVLVRIGDGIDVDDWCANTASYGAGLLTRELAQRLREVTFDFASDEQATRIISIARTLSGLATDSALLGDVRKTHDEIMTAGRIDRAIDAMGRSPASLRIQADECIAALQQIEARLWSCGMTLHDAMPSPRISNTTWFALREAIIAAALLPAALLARLSRFPPLAIARSVAMATLRHDPSRDQPAMRTILFGLLALPLCLGCLTILATLRFGLIVGALTLFVLVAASGLDALCSPRLARAVRRTRAFLLRRNDPASHASVVNTFHALQERATELVAALIQADA